MAQAFNEMYAKFFVCMIAAYQVFLAVALLARHQHIFRFLPKSRLLLSLFTLYCRFPLSVPVVSYPLCPPPFPPPTLLRCIPVTLLSSPAWLGHLLFRFACESSSSSSRPLGQLLR